MTRALLLVALAAVALASAGCGVGPANDRLYVNDWKSKRTRPIQLQADWKYQGEHWERGALETVATPVQ